MGVVGADGRWLRVNRAICELSGLSEGALLDRSLQDVVEMNGDGDGDADVATLLEHLETHPGASLRRFTRANGEHGAARVTVSRVPTTAGGAPEFIAQLEDVSELQQASERLARAAPADALTGLPGRRVFIRDVALQIDRCRRNGEKAALVLIEIDDFFEFTVRHGRSAADAALVALTEALRGRLRRTDIVARVGDHRFAALLSRDKDAAPVAQVIRQLVAGVQIPIDGDPGLTATVGIGVIDKAVFSAEVALNELEETTSNERVASAASGYPSRATTSLAGLRGMQWMRTRLGVGAVVVVAASGIAYGVHLLVSHPVTVAPPVQIRNAVASISRQDIAVSNAGYFSVPVHCSGAVCRGVIALTSTIPTRRTTARSALKAGRTTILASARFVMPPGSQGSARGRLNRAGRRLLTADRGRVPADVTVTLYGGSGYSPALSIHIVHSTARATTPGAATSPAPGASAPLPAPSIGGSGSVDTGTLPSAPAGRCQQVDVTPGATSAPQTLATTLCLINAQRAVARLPELRENTLLDQAATAHNNDMIANDYFAHVSPNGQTPLGWITATGYLLPQDGYVIGENIAWGTYTLATPRAIVAAWMNSPDHRANILNPSYTVTGIAIAPGVPASLGLGQPGALYTENFAGVTG